MSALPPSLNVSLKRFQSASHTIQRVQAPGTFSGSGQLVFQFPRSGCIDLHSLALVATATLTGTGTIVTQPFHSGMIRQLSVFVGGQKVGVDSSDYGFLYSILKVYSNSKPMNDFKQSSREGNVTLTTATAQDIIIASDFLGLLSGQNCRYLCLDVLPEVVVQIDLKPLSSWGSATTLTAGTLTNVSMMYSRIDFENNLLAQLWADRVSKTPIQIAYPNLRYYEGTQTTASSSVTSLTVNSGSVDYIIAGNRPDYSAGLSTALYLSNNGGGGLAQMFWNGVPLQGWAMSDNECLVASMASLNASGSTGFSPDFTVGTAIQPSGGEYGTNYFALVHRMKFDTEVTDPSNYVTGVNTYGAGCSVDFQMTGTTVTARRPWIAIYSSGVLEIGAGKQVLNIQ
jgi:hypothetical protein